MWGAVAERIFQKVQDHLDAIGIVAGDVVFTGDVPDGHGIVGAVRPLAEVERVSGPVQQGRTRIEIPLTAPAALNVFLVVRAPGSGSQPEIPVTFFRIRGWFSGQPGIVQDRSIDRRVQGVEFPEFAALGQLDGGLKIRHAAALGAGLENAFGALDGFGEPLAAVDGDAARFFAVNVFARFGGEDRRIGVPAIPGGDEDGVDIPAFEEFPEVPIEFAGGSTLQIIDESLAGDAPQFLDIGDGHAAYVVVGQHSSENGSAAWTDANDAQSDLIIGGALGGGDFGQGGKRGDAGGCGGQELAPRALPGGKVRFHRNRREVSFPESSESRCNST